MSPVWQNAQPDTSTHLEQFVLWKQPEASARSCSLCRAVRTLALTLAEEAVSAARPNARVDTRR